MKTALPPKINAKEDAQQFLTALYTNGETFHPEDDAHTIKWETCNPTPAECDQLNQLMEDIYNLDGNNGNHATPKFDPCEFLQALEYASKAFAFKDLSGRGISSELTGDHIYCNWDLNEMSDIDIELREFLQEGYTGDTWKTDTVLLTRTK